MGVQLRAGRRVVRRSYTLRMRGKIINRNTKLGSPDPDKLHQPLELRNAPFKISYRRSVETVHKVVSESSKAIPQFRSFHRYLLEKVPLPVVGEVLLRRKLSPKSMVKNRSESQEFAGLRVGCARLIDSRTFSKEILKERERDLEIRFDLGSLDGDAVARVVELVPQSVVPLNVAKVDT